MTSQTTLNQFFKITSNKNIGIGQKQQPSQNDSGQKRKANHAHRKPSVLRKRKTPTKMSNVVESEVKVLYVGTPPKNANENRNDHKRPNSSELENSPKKAKIDNSDIHKTPTKNILTLSPSQNTQTSSPNSQSTSKNAHTPIKKDDQTPLKVRSVSSINSAEKKSNFTPKQQKGKSSPTKTISPRKLFFADRINMDTVQQALENLNLVRQGSITLNEFDLESIYRERDFSYVYNENTDPTSQKFEVKDIVFPKEKHADHLMMICMDVFSEPINCGYFLKSELNKIFKLFTTSGNAQMLFVRLLKRKPGWHRTNNVKYPEIADDLNPFFKELVDAGFCTSDLDSIETSTLLNMLQADEVKHICQKLKIDHKGNKSVLMSRLEKYGASSKTFFIGSKSPKTILRTEILNTLQMCASLSEEIFNLFDKVLTLLHPIQDPTESIADLFLMLTTVHKGEILYACDLKKEPFPVFKNRTHLMQFVQSKNAYREVLACIENKEWDKVQDLGRLALRNLQEGQSKHVRSTLPLHVQKFVPEYNWTKVLSRSVEAFKKTPETIPEAVKALQTLIDDKHFCQSSRGRWYGELALIEMHHKKDLEASAALTLHALQQDSLTEVDVSGLIDRLRKLVRRKNGISNETKANVQETLDDVIVKGLTPPPTNTKTITATMANRAEVGGKSTWSITVNGSDKYYGSVEVLAMQHYTSEEDYHEALHCEGSLPVSLFTIFFWDELYKISVPGVFVSPYQEAPLDLFTAEFYENRKEKIDEKLSIARALDLESFAQWMLERYSSYVQYRTIMPNSLFKTDQQFKEVVTCLGINVVTGICERLVSNYRLWRSGFPDLIVWNKITPKCKIVEVKGPGDSLSEKQKLWLQYLERLGVEVQVCLVEALGRSSK